MSAVATSVGIAAVLVVLAGVLASVEAALARLSPARAREIVAEGRGGNALLTVSADPPPFINTVLLVRISAEIGATVLVAQLIASRVEATWVQVLVPIAVMVVLSYVAVGVGPRTVGRQHVEWIARRAARGVVLVTRVLGPVPRLLIALGNALTPGRGFREGPFASEAELREMVDLAEASRQIESGESQMIHSVFELGDTIVREVMVPRTDVVFIERHKTLRQTMSLALRSGFSRIPVVGDTLDDVVGMAYLKDVTRRVFDLRASESTEKVESVMRPCLYVPDTKHADALLREMQAQRTHVAIVVDEFGGTAGMVTIEDILEEIVGEITDEYDLEPDQVEHLGDGSVRVSSRLDVDDLAEMFGVEIDDDDVDTVGGLVAKRLGMVPLPGSVVEVEGLRLLAEDTAGRRNRIGTVVVSRVVPGADADAPTDAD